MPGHQSYIVRLLRRTEASLAGKDMELIRGRLGKVVQKISRADDIRAALELLYSVQGFDAFAMRLMWVLERPVQAYNGLEGEIMDFEVRQLTQLLAPRPGYRPELPAPPEAPMDALFESLHRFGREVEKLKRNTTKKEKIHATEPDALYRILNECAALEDAADKAGHPEVKRFCASFSKFTQYVIDDDRLSDGRVVNIMDNANMTLQTVLESYGAEDYDALQQMMTLLEDPQRLLE